MPTIISDEYITPIPKRKSLICNICIIIVVCIILTLPFAFMVRQKTSFEISLINNGNHNIEGYLVLSDDVYRNIEIESLSIEPNELRKYTITSYRIVKHKYYSETHSHIFKMTFIASDDKLIPLHTVIKGVCNSKDKTWGHIIYNLNY